jgi:uncharacterized protein GlcG (DUF336 family)
MVRAGRLTFVAGLVMMLAPMLPALPARELAAAQSVQLADVAAQSAEPADVATQSAAPEEVATQQVDPSVPLTLAEARAIIEGAIGYARSIDQPIGVSVLDPGGHVISQDLMDGPGFATLNHANGKAFAAAMLRTPTSQLASLLDTSPSRYYSIMNMWPGQVYLTGGGIPLRANGRVLGAAGASGTRGQDAQAIQAGIAAWARLRSGVEQ